MFVWVLPVLLQQNIFGNKPCTPRSPRSPPPTCAGRARTTSRQREMCGSGVAKGEDLAFPRLGLAHSCLPVEAWGDVY